MQKQIASRPVWGMFPRKFWTVESFQLSGHSSTVKMTVETALGLLAGARRDILKSTILFLRYAHMTEQFASGDFTFKKIDWETLYTFCFALGSWFWLRCQYCCSFTVFTFSCHPSPVSTSFHPLKIGLFC